jgi:hypothetical protein
VGEVDGKHCVLFRWFHVCTDHGTSSPLQHFNSKGRGFAAAKHAIRAQQLASAPDIAVN